MNQCLHCNKACEKAADFCDACWQLLQDGPPEEAFQKLATATRDLRAVSLWESDALSPHPSTALLVAETPQLPFEEEDNPWTTQLDPLGNRHLPTVAEAAPIEEADIRLAFADSDTAELIPPHAGIVPVGPKRRPSRIPPRLRIAFAMLAIIALLALIVDGVLVPLVFTNHRQQSAAQASNDFPTLSITPNTAHSGQLVLTHISHFSPSATVLLTRDIQQTVRLGTPVGSTQIETAHASTASLVKAESTGDVDVHLLVDDSWGVGFHIVEAEDATTHYTASATLHVTGVHDTLPPHLNVSPSMLNMGTDVQGANTLQMLTLSNTGGGVIPWIASSDQPWLVLSPAQGVLSDSQSLFVGVTRAKMKAGNYQGRVTIFTSIGQSTSVQVNMSVQSLPSNAPYVLSVTPPVLSFDATDGGLNPTDQFLAVNNPGSQPLHWSITSAALPASSDSASASLSDASWLSTNPTSGTVKPGSVALVHVIVHSQQLLPSVYSALLTVTSDQYVLNSPQTVAVSLTVQPGCGVITSMGSVPFTVISGQTNPAEQSLSLSTTMGCANALNWRAFSSDAWLSVTPASGQIPAKASTVVTLGVNAETLSAGTYNGTVIFSTSQRTQTILVPLMVLPSSAPPKVGQPTPTTGLGASPVPGTPTLGPGGTPAPGGSPLPGSSPTVVPGPGNTPTPGPKHTPTPGPGNTPTPTPGNPPVLSVSSLNLSFSATQGQPSPRSQLVTMTNTGGSSLNWQAVTNSSNSPWPGLSALQGIIAAGHTVQITVSANTSGLAAGTYSTQFWVTATDSAGRSVQGSPQIFSVSLTVSQPCVLQATPNNLSFTAILLQNPPAQSVTLRETGNCAYPTLWRVSSNAPWLTFSASSGVDTGSGSTIGVKVNASGILLGVYSGQITLVATDSHGASIQGSPQVISVTLTVIL